MISIHIITLPGTSLTECMCCHGRVTEVKMIRWSDIGKGLQVCDVCFRFLHELMGRILK